MINYDDSIDKMLKKIADLESSLQKLVVKIGSSTETTIGYWSNIQKQVRDIYDEMRMTFASWGGSYIEKEYSASIQDAIRDIKSIGFSTKIKIDDIVNMHASRQSINTLLTDSLNNFERALQAGDKKINRVIQSTQQLNISEKQVNDAVGRGFDEGGSTFYAKRELRDELLDSIADGKVVQVIDINGRLINYDVNYYAEMVARTKLREAQTAGVLQTAASLDQDLVAVSPNPGCDLCNEYAGKIFSISGNDPDFPPLDDDPPFHMHCTHSLTIYVREFMSDDKIEKDIDFSNSDETVQINDNPKEYSEA